VIQLLYLTQIKKLKWTGKLKEEVNEKMIKSTNLNLIIDPCFDKS